MYLLWASNWWQWGRRTDLKCKVPVQTLTWYSDAAQGFTARRVEKSPHNGTKETCDMLLTKPRLLPEVEISYAFSVIYGFSIIVLCFCFIRSKYGCQLSFCKISSLENMNCWPKKLWQIGNILSWDKMIIQNILNKPTVWLVRI